MLYSVKIFGVYNEYSNDVTNIEIDTPRLLLRSWQEHDLEDFFAYASVDGVGEMAGWKHHESITETKNILHSFISDKNVFALELKATKKVIGSLGLHYSWANNEKSLTDLKVKEIGYVLSKAYWGQGLMPEAVNAVIDYCFNELDLDALTVGHFVGNTQSKRVIEKNGFVYVTQDTYTAKELNKTFVENKYILFRKQHNIVADLTEKLK